LVLAVLALTMPMVQTVAIQHSALLRLLAAVAAEKVGSLLLPVVAVGQAAVAGTEWLAVPETPQTHLRRKGLPVVLE
jgi:hypothetical protein